MQVYLRHMKLLWDDVCLQWVEQIWSQSFVDACAPLLPSKQITWSLLEPIQSLTSVQALKRIFYFCIVSFSPFYSEMLMTE